MRFNFLPAVPDVRRSKFSAVSRRARLALGVVGAVAVIASLSGAAGAGPSEANINSDANYAISITRNLNTVNLGDVVSWTVTFKHTATTGLLDQSASLSVSVPASVTPISWQCVAQTGSFCNSRGGSQSASTSGTGQPILLPGLAFSGAAITVTVTGAATAAGALHVEAKKHDADGALAGTGVTLTAFDDSTVAASAGSTTSSTSTIAGATTTSTTKTTLSGATTTSSTTTTTNPGPCFISGAIWRDENADGVAGAEPGVGNLKVSVLTTNPVWTDTNGDGQPAPGEPGVLAQVLTDSSGNFFSPVLGCGINVRVQVGPLKNPDGTGYTVTKQWTVNNLPGNPGLIAPGRLSKFAVSGNGMITDAFDSGAPGAKQIDGGLIPIGGSTTTSTVAPPTSAAVTTLPPAPTTLPPAPTTVATPPTTLPAAPGCSGDAAISSRSASSLSAKRNKSTKITLTLRSTCPGSLSVRFNAAGLKLTTTGPSQGSIGGGVWTVDDYDPAGPAPTLSLSASASTKGTKQLSVKLTQAGDANSANNSKAFSVKVS